MTTKPETIERHPIPWRAHEDIFDRTKWGIEDAEGDPVVYPYLPRRAAEDLVETVNRQFSAALSVPAAAVVGEPVAYASSKEWRKNHLMSAAQYKNALPKNVVDFDIPLYATLPDEALERSEQATFDIAARLLKERDALASRISQQDAELERLRREVEEAKRQIDFGIHQSDLERATIVARRDAFSEAEEVVRHLCSNNEEAISALRAKAEETRT